MRLLSFNIHKGIGGRDRRYRLNRIMDVIEAESPDIVCLQEVDRHVRRSRSDDQPALFVERLQPAAHLFQLNVHLKVGGYGNLLLSRWPFLSHHQVSLSRQQRKPRGVQLAVIDTPSGPLQLVHWHLGLSDRERHWQARRLLEHHLFREAHGIPSLIVGDFNDWRNTLAGGPFEVHGFHHVTAPASRFRSFPAWLPTLSLDKAFIRGAIQVQRAHIVRSRATRTASDHLPLVLDFDLGKA
ncbi:MAG: endonuclease/exonuclease/phosphatase family protein [Planctomycetota bacterium]